MVTRKDLKAYFLLWVFTAGLSTTSSSFQFVSYQKSQIDHVNDLPITIDCQEDPPPDHANEPPADSYQNPPPVQTNPPSSGDTSSTHQHRHHHHHHAQKPPTNCDLPPYHNPTAPPPTGGGGNSSPPSEAPPSADHKPLPPCGGCTYGHPPISSPVGPVVAPSPNEHENPSMTPPSIDHSTNSSSQTKNNNAPQPKTPAIAGDNSQPLPSFPNIPFIHGGTCNFWKRHPNLVSGLLTWWHTAINRAIGRGKDAYGIHINFEEALSNTRTDGISALYREGAAALLNSMVNKNFPFTMSHIRDSFLAALASNKAAMAQAEVFKLANEGRLKPRV